MLAFIEIFSFLNDGAINLLLLPILQKDEPIHKTDTKI